MDLCNHRFKIHKAGSSVSIAYFNYKKNFLYF